VPADFAQKLAQTARQTAQDGGVPVLVKPGVKPGKLLTFRKFLPLAAGIAAAAAAAAAVAAVIYFQKPQPTSVLGDFSGPSLAAVSVEALPDHALLLTEGELDSAIAEIDQSDTFSAQEDLLAAVSYEQTLEAQDVSTFSDATLLALFAE
jgi:hypothetical protein